MRARDGRGAVREVCFVTGAHVDQAIRLSGSPRAGHSNPGAVETRPGGAGLNAATAAAALGLRASMAGPVGRDANAAWLRETLARRGIGDALAQMEGARTGLYAAIVAADGDLAFGVADLEIYDRVDAAWLASHCGPALERADCWFVNGNLREAALRELAAAAGGRLLAACTVSPAKAGRLAAIAGRIDLLFANAAEAAALAGQAGEPPALARLLASRGIRAGVITQGAGPVAWWDGEAAGAVDCPPAGRIVDVVGAGDALAGTVLAGRARGLPMARAVRYGVGAAQATIASAEPAREDLDWQMLAAMIGETFDGSSPA